MYVLRFRERLSIEFPFCVLPAGEECLIRRKWNGNLVGVSGECIRCFTPSLKNLQSDGLKLVTLKLFQTGEWVSYVRLASYNIGLK